MWAVKNHTPYAADRVWGRDKDGVHEWIVAVKGTFDIKPDGSTKLADEQLKPLLLPEYHGEPGANCDGDSESRVANGDRRPHDAGIGDRTRCEWWSVDWSCGDVGEFEHSRRDCLDDGRGDGGVTRRCDHSSFQ